MTHENAQDLNNEYEAELLKLYPTFKWGSGNVSSMDGNVTSQQYDVSVYQDYLKNTSYDPNGVKDFIHYTSLDSLYGILNSCEIRLFDLNNMNDPFEFNYLIKKLGLTLNKEQIQFFKRSLFVTSLCAFSGKDEFDLWRLYGKDGKGVGIVFEVINTDDSWRKILLGKVIYGANNDACEQIKKAIDLTNLYVNERKMRLQRLPALLGLLLLHHKNEIWGIEREYRLSTVAMHYNEYDMKPDLNFFARYANTPKYFLNSFGNRLSYISFPLEFKLREDLSKSNYSKEDIKDLLREVPQIRIKKIIAGYALNKEFVKRLNEFVFQFCSDKWNDYVQVENSYLYDAFND